MGTEIITAQEIFSEHFCHLGLENNRGWDPVQKSGQGFKGSPDQRILYCSLVHDRRRQDPVAQLVYLRKFVIHRYF